MKTRLLLSALLMLCAPLDAAIPLAGSGSYSQNFNALPYAAGTTWVNNSTIPGWWLHRSATAASAPIRVSNGSGSWAAGTYSLGATSLDLALGSAPTTSLGNHSHIVIFQNNSTSPLRLANLRYDLELFRTNSYYSAQEHLRFSWAVSLREDILLGEMTEGFPLDDTRWQQDDGLSVFSYEFIGAGFPTTSGVINPAATITRNRAPTTPIEVPAGWVLALRWEDTNDLGEDSYSGIDNVVATFQSIPCMIRAGGYGQAYHTNNTTGVDDDYWTATLWATRYGTGANSWTIPGRSITANYGTYPTATFNQAESRVLLTPQDSSVPSCTTSYFLEAPVTSEIYIRPFEPQGINFDAATSGAVSWTRRAISPDASWTSTGGGNSGVRQQPGLGPNGPRYLEMFSGTGMLTSQRIFVAGTGSLTASVDVGAYTTNATGLEAVDGVTVRLEGSPDGTFSPATTLANLLPLVGGDQLWPQIRIGTGTNYGPGAGQTPYPATPFTLRNYKVSVPPYNGAVRFVATLATDSVDEHILVDNLSVGFANCAIHAQVDSPTRTNPAGNDNSPATDVFSFYLTATNEDTGLTGYNISPGGLFRVYGGTFTMGPFPATGPVTLTLTDSNNPSCTTLVTVQPPARYTYGTLKDGGVNKPIITTLTYPPHPRWANDPGARTIYQGLEPNSDSRNGTNTVRSVVLPAPAGLAGEPVVVFAILEAADTSTDTGFETPDFFRAFVDYHIGGGGSLQSANLITRYDRDASGTLTGSGASGVAAYNANPALDEFNLSLSPASAVKTHRLVLVATLPANTSDLQIILEGECGTALTPTTSETFVLRELEVTRGTTRTGIDSDADGQSDWAEWLVRTDPLDPLSFLGFTTANISNTGGVPQLQASFSSQAGVYYGVYYSADLRSWTLRPPVLTGTGNILSVNFSPPGSAPKLYFRMDARGSSSFPPVINQ